MLIDFSDALQINVFTLGAVFLQLCKVLRLDNSSMFTKCALLLRPCQPPSRAPRSQSSVVLLRPVVAVARGAKPLAGAGGCHLPVAG